MGSCTADAGLQNHCLCPQSYLLGLTMAKETEMSSALVTVMLSLRAKLGLFDKMVRGGTLTLMLKCIIKNYNRFMRNTTPVQNIR